MHRALSAVVPTDGVPGITELREEKVQDAPIELFTSLECNDVVLFVDTSHTVKTGGDVPWIYHEILPRLRPGVLVHIHDVFLPGDYPQAWVFEGWGVERAVPGPVVSDVQRGVRDHAGRAMDDPE